METSEGKRRDGGGLFEVAPSVVAAAHELKSPLVLVRQLALVIEQDPQRAVEYAERIALTADRALRLTSDLTRAARLEDSFFESEPLNALKLLEEVADEMAPLYQAHGRELTIASRRQSPLVVANHDLVRRVLLGFTDNALMYADRDTPVQLSLGAKPQRGVVRLEVRDFGPSVVKNTIKNISKSIGVRPVSASTRPASSGLGLYLAQQFASMMHARVGLIRHRDGASFYIDVPISTQLYLL
ncbi:MAG TPA: HAMP domain-containing sensor histidine kinase [Candidatus Saccharimonadaceae bacterium]|nr:HAMP domain-containing sensor histidine kinase [Candidatus Saccharimonadaceae bacterium]